MCVTEIWSYRECGCSYNHKILCRSYRREPTPHFGPVIQYPLDKWLEETALASEANHLLLRPQTMPLEPGHCPNRRVVEKSFLNQICEDCFQAELDGMPSRLSAGSCAQDASPANSDNGEGLVWDSEVKIEIEDPYSSSPSLPEATLQDQEVPDEDKRILESHVEITIEDEDNKTVTKSAASPEMIASQRKGRSQLSLMQTSPPSMPRGDLCQPDSRASGSKKYGRDFRKTKVSSCNDAHTDSGVDLQCFHRDSQPLFRGRSLTCSNLRKARVREPDEDDGTQIPAEESISFKGLSSFQNLKSLSMSLRVGPRSLVAATGHCGNPGMDQVSSSSSTGTSSKNPLRIICRRKGSPRIRGTSASMCVDFQQTSADIHDDTPIPGAQDAPAIPPRKSSLKNFALFLMEDFTRTKGLVQSRSGSQFGSLTPTPTISWLHQHAGSSEETNSSTQGSVSHSETTFESASGDRSPNTNGARGMKAEKGFLIPSIPKSSTMNTMRAIIDGWIDRDFGLDDQDEATPQPTMSGKEEARH